MSEAIDWEGTYQGNGLPEAGGGVPWNIGEPQPVIAERESAGLIRSDVLDAGCGVGETAVYLAERGYTVVGLDGAPTAIAQARETAARRGVEVEFGVADISDFTGYDNRFATIVDSALFHSLPVDRRSGYLHSIARAAAPGAVLHMLCFSTETRFPAGRGPNPLSEQELRSLVGELWEIDELRPATITAEIHPESGVGEYPRDERGRVLLPALRLTAHRPS
jgi:SAM-dependent methyltransferase